MSYIGPWYGPVYPRPLDLDEDPEVVCRWCGAEDAHYSEHCPELHPMATGDLDDDHHPEGEP